jgi:hypothetical protein
MNYSEPLSYLVYTSTAKAPFNDDQLLELLRESRDRNSQRDVTGALIYKNGIFVQMLEGPTSDIEELREKIYRDPRHVGVMTLIRGAAELRIFSEWTMHFISPRERDLRESELTYRCLNGSGDIEDMLESSGQYKASAEQDGLHPGLRLLLMFRQIM